MRLVIAMRFQGETKRLFDIRQGAAGDWYANLLDANPLAGFPPLERHMSYHAGGERHLKIRGWPSLIGSATVPPPASIRGVQRLLQTAIMRGQFMRLKPLRREHEGVVVLETDSAGFRDDWTNLNVFLVEAGQDDQIPQPPGAGPLVVHVHTATTPWLAVQAFQQKRP
jgi:hypothetical protein